MLKKWVVKRKKVVRVFLYLQISCIFALDFAPKPMQNGAKSSLKE
jgi:hypothetical protein